MTRTYTADEPEYYSTLLEESVDAAVVIIKDVLGPYLRHRRPPFTRRLTVADLRKMPVQAAVAKLRDELARTTVVDPKTMRPVMDGDTAELVGRYLAETQDAFKGDTYGR